MWSTELDTVRELPPGAAPGPRDTAAHPPSGHQTAAASFDCPALFISAPASGQGKTTVTAALARWHARQGRRVRVFKTGPDFLDPMILSRACGLPVLSLDLTMVGERACRRLLADAARDADLILIEGVMGLYDGTPSSADLACLFNVPVAAVVSAKGMAQTFAALTYGLAHFRPSLPFLGVLANHVSSERHADMLQERLPSDLRWLGHLARSDDIALPERHLGLHQADEIDSLDARIDQAADAVGRTALAALPAPVAFFAETDATEAAPERTLTGTRIAVARDAAFSFLYPENLRLLDALGAEVMFFSPLADDTVPADASAVFLPGGYPELHANALSANARTAASLRAHAKAGKRIVAECGGMLYLLDALIDQTGKQTPMLGLLPGTAAMQARLAGLGMLRADTPQGLVRGHTFHYSTMATPLVADYWARPDQHHRPGEPVYTYGAITATYMHMYWPSNPAFAAALFQNAGQSRPATG